MEENDVLPTYGDIEKMYPNRAGQNVVMQSGMSYYDTIEANKYRMEGALWMRAISGEVLSVYMEKIAELKEQLEICGNSNY